MPEEPFIYRFTFKDGVPIEVIEKNLYWAAFGTECEHGKEKVRLGTGYSFSSEKRQAVIDGTTHVGEAIAKMFSGFMSEECGETCFTVERLPKINPLPEESSNP